MLQDGLVGNVIGGVLLGVFQIAHHVVLLGGNLLVYRNLKLLLLVLSRQLETRRPIARLRMGQEEAQLAVRAPRLRRGGLPYRLLERIMRFTVQQAAVFGERRHIHALFLQFALRHIHGPRVEPHHAAEADGVGPLRLVDHLVAGAGGQRQRGCRIYINRFVHIVHFYLCLIFLCLISSLSSSAG